MLNWFIQWYRISLHWLSHHFEAVLLLSICFNSAPNRRSADTPAIKTGGFWPNITVTHWQIVNICLLDSNDTSQLCHYEVLNKTQEPKARPSIGWNPIRNCKTRPAMVDFYSDVRSRCIGAELRPEGQSSYPALSPFCRLRRLVRGMSCSPISSKK